MKHIDKYLFVLFLAMITTQGCKDDLSLSPLDAPSNVSFFETEEQLLLAINGAYRQALWLQYGSNPIIGFENFDLLTDTGFERGGGAGGNIAQGGHSSTTGTIENTWTHFYRAIGRANNLLDNMHRAEANVSDGFYQRIQAEARFLRAFSYLYLTELYGDVPLITEVPAPDEAQIGRTPKQVIVDQMITDLDFAAEILPPVWSGNDAGRATSGAALAIKARAALFNERYDVAAEAAKQVMDLGTYSLYPDYETLFLYEGERNPEVILDIPFMIGLRTNAMPRARGPRNAPGTGWSYNVPSQFMIDSYEAIDGKPIDKSDLYDPANPFENRDPRLDASIIRPQSIWGGYIYESHPDSVETWIVNEAGEHVGRRSNLDATHAFSSFTGYQWRKYVDPQDYPERISNSELNFILIRYAEVLLIYAEARIESGNIDPSVLDAMNKVRARAYGVDSSETSQYPAVTTLDESELRRLIRRERKVELASEGLRLFDIRRWRIAEEMMNGPFLGRPVGSYTTVSTPQIDPVTGHPNYGGEESLYRNVQLRSFNPNRDYLWPIPQAELDVNEQMTQNSGY